MDPIVAVVLAILALVAYFVPAIIASARSHKNSTPIFIANLFFGWTFIGWVGCLIWACTYQQPRTA